MAREDLFPTDHLREKMKERDVSWGEIIDVVNYYENSYGPDEKGRMTFQKGDLCVVADSNGAVTTVLLRRETQWDSSDARTRTGAVNSAQVYRESQAAIRNARNTPKKTHGHYKRKKAQKRKNNGS